jgi:DMSO/TMAO reductase YedYZ heme-binding membrane subunit
VNQQFWWYVARASGLVAWGLATASVLWGLALSTKVLGARPRSPWLLDLHRFLGTLTAVFVAVHLAGLAADSYTHFGWSDLFVPLASAWKPGPVAWGVVAVYLLFAIQVSSCLMRRLPRRVWHAIHLSSWLLYVTATVHTLTAGTDRHNRAVLAMALVSVALVVFGTAYRLVGPGKAALRRAAPRRAPAEAA